MMNKRHQNLKIMELYVCVSFNQHLWLVFLRWEDTNMCKKGREESFLEWREMSSIFPSIGGPPERYFWGKFEAQLESSHPKEAGRLATFIGGGRPATPPSRPAKGKNGKMDLLAGHHMMVSSHVCTTRPYGWNLATLKQEKQQATFQRGSKMKGRITGRP